jgi:hypothetical protein
MIPGRRIAVLAASAALLLSGCASSFHGSYLVGERYFKTRIDTQPVIILGVDDRDTTQRRVLVDPGTRRVRVQAMPVPGAPNQTATLTIDVKPCHTYYIVAVRETPITANFQPQVDFVQPLGGCTADPDSQRAE